jgi:hypothetical protein
MINKKNKSPPKSTTSRSIMWMGRLISQYHNGEVSDDDISVFVREYLIKRAYGGGDGDDEKIEVLRGLKNSIYEFVEKIVHEILDVENEILSGENDKEVSHTLRDETKFSKNEVAEKYRVSVKTIGNWMKKGLTHTQLSTGRIYFTQQDLIDWDHINK